MYNGRNLFPDQNQIYRIRSTVHNIINEVSVRLGKKIGQSEFVNLLNQALRDKGYEAEATVNLSTINRLTLFGKNSASANSLKLLESLPLLHVLSEKYSETDLKRIALGQSSDSKDEVVTDRNTLAALRRQLLDAISVIDSLTGNEYVNNFEYDVDLDPDRKRFIFNQILGYKDNMHKVLESGFLTENELRAYQEEEVPDTILISMLASYPIPGPVMLMLKQMSGEYADQYTDIPL